MSQRTRGSESTLQVIVDNDLKGGSWAKVLDWEITPRESVDETGFTGEQLDDTDFQHSGYDFSMTLEELDQKLRDVHIDMVAREQARQAYPDVVLVLTIKHRAGVAPEVLVCEGAKFKFDSFAGSSKKDPIKTKISGKFKKLTRMP